MPQSSSFADDLATIRNPTPSAGSFADDLAQIRTGYSVSPDVGALIGSAGAPLPKPPSPTIFQPPPPPARNFDVNQKTGERVTPLPIGTVPVLDAPAIGIPQAARGAKNLVTDPSLGAANDVIEGLFKTAEPLMAGAAIANPLLTGQMVLRSVIASKFGEDVAGSVGASEEGKRLSGNVAALLSGGLGVKKFAEKVAADARVVAEQVRAYDAANPRPAPPETINVGRGATPAAAAERVVAPKPAPPETFAGDLDLIRPPEPAAPPVEIARTPAPEAPIAPVEPPPEPIAEPKISPDMRKILRKQGFSDATIDKMEQDQRVSVEAGDSREKVIPPTPITPRAAVTQPIEEPETPPEEAGPVGVPQNDLQKLRSALTLRQNFRIPETTEERFARVKEELRQEAAARTAGVAAEYAERRRAAESPQPVVNPSENENLATPPSVVENGGDEARNLPGEPLSPAAPPASAQVDEGQIAPGGEDQRPAPDESGLLAPGRREGRPAQRRAVGRTIKPDASADSDTLNELVARAVAGGYRGDTSTLRTDLTEKLQALRDIDSEFDDSGRNPIKLLKAIAKLGGISEAKETGQKGEIRRLKEFRDTRPNPRGGNLAKRIAMDSVRGVRGVFRDTGLALDDIVERLKQDPEFDHVQDIEDLTHEVELAANANEADALSAKRFVKGLGEKYWENVSEPIEGPAGEDVNEFGEVQPRLPEAGMVREQNIETPEFDAPFSLTAEIDKAVRERPSDLFGGDSEPHEFSSTQIDLPPAVARDIKIFADAIPDSDLAKDGRESDPHVTVKYGLHTSDVDEVQSVLRGQGPITVTFGKTSLFKNDDADILKVDVDSSDLHRLNQKISDALEVTDTHPEYVPHATIAYLKPGKGEEYSGDESFLGKTATIDAITFSAKDGKVYEIPLRGRGEAAREPGADDVEESALSRFIREEEGSVPVPDDLKTIAKGMKQVAGEVAAVIAPQSRSPEAQRAADIVRLAMAKAANPGTIERMKADKRYGIGPSKGAEVAFAKGGKDTAIKDISTYERTGQFPAIKGLDAGYSTLYQDSQMASLIMYRYAYGADEVGYIENRVARLFRFPDRASQAKGEAFLNANARKLSADRGPTRRRVLDMPLDQALAQMKARGIDVEMASWNPEVIRQWDLENARLAAAMRDAWNDLKDGGLVTWVPNNQRAPSGLVAIHEKGAKFFYPRERGQGNYYADENVARVLNNVVSDGLGMKATVAGIMWINNAYNQLQLGVSMFHAGATAIHSSAADAHIALRRLMGGTPSESVLPALRAMVPGLSFARDIYRGRRFVEDLKRDNPVVWDVLENKLNPGGVRLQMQQDYRTDMIKSMTEAWREGKYDKVIVRLPFAAVEAIAKPLMEYGVPRVKLAVALDRIAEVDRRMPNATLEQKHRAYAAAADQIDNKFGLLVYDNGFWKRTHRQAAHMSVRSVGWTFGTLRWGVGTAADMGHIAKDLASGKHPDVSDRLIDALVYPLVAAYLGAIYYYLSTGERPKEGKDYFYPKNSWGGRTALPTYMKDVYSYSQDPLHTILQKQSPVLESTYDLLKNENYFGVLIADQDDPWIRQQEDRGKYLIENALPFSITQGRRIWRESGGDTSRAAEAFVGLTPASAAVSRTPMQRYLHGLVPPAHLTHEQAARAQTRRDVRALAEGGRMDEAVETARKEGQSPASIRATLRTAREGIVRTQFNGLSWNQAVKAYTLAEPEERQPLQDVMARKLGTALSAAPDQATIDKTLETYNDLMKLPTDETQPKFMAPSLMPNAQTGATAP